jgi:hypothetical protein
MSIDLENLVVELVRLRDSVNNTLIQIRSFFPVNTKIPRLKDSGFQLVAIVESRITPGKLPVPPREGPRATERGSRAKPGEGMDFQGLVAWEAVERYMLRRGKPARTTEIASALIKHGFRSGSSNFRGFVYQVLRKKPTVFCRVERGLWALKRWEER